MSSISLEIVTHEENRSGRRVKIDPVLRIEVRSHNGDPYNPFDDVETAEIPLRDLKKALAELE